MEEEKIQQQPRPKDSFKAWADPLFTDLRRLFSRAKLREVMTHSSFYEQESKGNGRSSERRVGDVTSGMSRQARLDGRAARDVGKANSRYVFAGMFVFKGQVANVLFRYYTGDGTRLQHILGNLFRQERLVRLFDEWRLHQFVRAGEKFDITAHKHIFVYALFGYVSTLDENTQNWFISKYILSDEVVHLLSHKKRNRDLLAQADDMVRQADGRRLSIEMEVTDEGQNKAKAMLSDGSLLCEAVSKSWRYARTKVTKLALNILATPFRKEMLSNPDYQARILAREEEKIAKRKAEIEARDAAKEALRAEKREQRKAEARIRDAKRRKSQAEAKKRKAENAAKAAAKAAKEARPMSAKKRRYLEDKKK